MTQQELAALIEQAKQERWTDLNLNFLNLTELPESIGDIADLTNLYLTHNRLSKIPESLGRLANISCLDISANQLNIKSLEIVCELNSLKKLDISDNSLEILPETIGKLNKLERLNAYGNHLKTLPLSIEKLINLTEIDLGCNKIANLDDRFKFPINLERIYLGDNKISNLSEYCDRLKKPYLIELSDNPLTDLSPLQFLPNLQVVGFFEVELPRRYWMKFSDWNPEWLLDEENAEIRRVLIDRVGYEKIYDKLGAIEIDAWREYELMRIDGSVDIEPILLLKMTCPSTQHIHILRVPPTTTSAEDAITWVNHGIHPDNFAVQT